MKPSAAVALFLSVVALLPGSAPLPAAASEDAVSIDWVADDQACRCKAGNACWHYLRAPVDPPLDLCWCNFCAKVSRHDGTRPMPEGWSEICASNQKMDCFLKRHAATWGMLCSECSTEDQCACRTSHNHNCPKCEKAESPWDPDARKEIQYRLQREQELFASKSLVVIASPHFYVCTDMPSLKFKTIEGVFRIATTHELAHIYVERAEKARREFVQNFGDEVSMSAPSAIFIPKRESTAAKIQARYFSSARTNLLYGGGAKGGRVADGFCGNGFCHSLEKAGGDDIGLHHAVRHQVGHLLISTYTNGSPNERNLPPWMFEGAAHWLAKRHPLLKDEVVWCANEGSPISGSGRDWPNDARKVAADTKTVPVERLIEKSTIGQLEYDDHVRAWSYFELGLKEDREAFVNLIKSLRAATPTRQAWSEAQKCTPDEWDQRWRDRLLGRRPTLGHWAGAKESDEGPGAADRRAIRAEQDIQNLVARIRAIGTCNDAKTAKVLVEQFGRDSDAVREVLVVVLSKTTDPAVMAAIRDYGLASPVPPIRAFTARVLGFMNDQGAIEALRLQVADAFWLARAEAALALMRLKDPKLGHSVKPLLTDQAAKVRIAALDALGTAGEGGEVAVAFASECLNHEAWQVRSAAADSLGALGSMMGVDALVNRMTTEAGRIRKDCYEALKLITRDDLGLNPENWAKWWRKERERVNGGIPNRPDAPKEENPDDARYARRERPYGQMVFDERVGYLLDMSNSMFNLFEPDPEAVKKLSRKYKGSTKFDISREEIVQSIQKLDQRTRFNVMVFSNKPRWMNNGLVPATPDNHKKAEGFLKSCRSSPDSGGGTAQMTSFFDAFRAIFDLPKGSSLPPPNFTDTPDTFFFLTDGEPTIGEITDSDELLAWFNGLNRFARIKVFVVAYGNTGIDLPFLTHLAEDNRGKLIHIHEAPPDKGPEMPGTTPK